jgi:hypothetical protein
MLAISGVLNHRHGGPGVMAPLPPELTETLLRDQWKVHPVQEEHYRRSIYLFARRNLRYPILEVFDRPDANASCARRNRSTTAPQALLMMNSDETLTWARRFAGRVMNLAEPDRQQQVTLAFRLALGREPSLEECRLSLDFLDKQQALLQQEQRDADGLALPIPWHDQAPSSYGASLVDFCLALLNSNELVYVD